MAGAAPPGKPSTHKEGEMPLLEQEATRMAAALDDYEHVSVSDIGGKDESGYWLWITDERFDLTYEIDCHADYWDFLGYLCSHLRWPAEPVRKGVA
jgi:hypothetical protein